MRVLLRRLKGAGESAVQSLARRFLRFLMALRQREWRGQELGGAAAVFAPHQDDEVLGCGGTILRKRQAGAHVTVVFMTDGSQSHAHLMGADELKRLRAAEAVEACRQLGVASENVHFLNFPDGQLGGHLDEAARRVAELLKRFQFAEVFIPHTQDGPPDHLATTQAVLAALREYPHPVTVFEYLVWIWCHWPWVGLPGKLAERVESLWQSIGVNWRLLWDCGCFVPIGDLRDRKRAALDQHKSQVTRLIPDPRWSVLGDVFDGEFLACFFQDREIFYRH